MKGGEAPKRGVVRGAAAAGTAVFLSWRISAACASMTLCSCMMVRVRRPTTQLVGLREALQRLPPPRRGPTLWGGPRPLRFPQKPLLGRSVGRSVCGYTPMTPRSPFATMQDKGLRSIYIQVERTSGQGRPSQNGRRGKATCMSVAVAMCGRVWGGCGVATLVWSLAGLSAPASAPLKPPGVKPPKTHDYELDVSYMFDNIYL